MLLVLFRCLYGLPSTTLTLSRTFSTSPAPIPDVHEQVMGAALFGANDRSIVSRKARLTYGVRSVNEYDKDCPAHRQRKGDVALIGGKMYLNTFSPFVERGEDLPVGTDREHSFEPVTECQISVSFDVTVSSHPVKDIKYLKDRGVNEMLSTVITVEVPVDTSVPFENRGLFIRLSFGGTELGIRGKRSSDGREVNATTVYIEEVVDNTTRGRIV